METFYKDKDILITGGAGSIGSAIARKLIEYKPKRIRIFDQSEFALHNLQQELKDAECMRYLIGTVRDKERLKKAMEGVEIVFHAAALKHVPHCEYNPYEAVMTNVAGTQNVLDAARDAKVKKFIAISTDKAVSPNNTMGATKLLAEKLVMNANFGLTETKYSAVRFGNVLFSNGSVIPMFLEQIRKGQDVTVTSDKMTRFIMSLNDAVKLILRAAYETDGREIYILKMPALKIADLAKVMIDEFGKGKNIKVKNIGVRPGERFHESLMTDDEARLAEEKEDVFVLKSSVHTPHLTLATSEKKKPIEPSKYVSEKAPHLTIKEIKELLLKESQFS